MEKRITDVWCPDADVRMMTPPLLTHGTWDSEPTGGFRGGGSFSLVFRPAEISTKMIQTPDSKEKNAVRFIFNLFNKEPSHCDTMQTREREKQSLSIEGSMQFPSAGINNSDSGSENNTKIIHHHVFVYYSYDFMFSDD